MSAMNNRESQIDYILINNKWKNCLKNCQAYSSFAKLRLSLRSKAAIPRKENNDWNVLKSDQELQNRYSIQLHNRFSMLQNELSDTIDDEYQHFITANKEAAKGDDSKESKASEDKIQ